ncbi:hypothetical protein M422DRAFT_261649 [Sphaerobolus stellatus SS14]|uniref:Uncharacterized protein n=1 Tax=Sphaerobolus stellatus (strain SS14) TaxID=990650 RepID=A0A0C9V2Z6_SPHS4|nr:hypothetical protein M422DRAFT_261649 [Sphaerobolus stellatus SS14]
MPLNKKLSEVMKRNDPTGIRLVEGAGAKLGIMITPNNRIAFDVLDPEVTMDGSGVTQLPYTVGCYEGNNNAIRNNVSVDFIELKYTGFQDIHALDSYYKSHTAGQFITDPTLKANGGSITIGYGSGEQCLSNLSSTTMMWKPK